MKKYEFFKVEGNKINRIRKHCPKCGPAVFLAEHKDRFSCGQCGYTEYKGGVKHPVKPNDKPVAEPIQKQHPAVKKDAQDNHSKETNPTKTNNEKNIKPSETTTNTTQNQ